MDKKIAVEINGRVHHLSDRAISLLNLKHRIVPKEKPFELKREPPKFDDIKRVEIKKAETKPEIKPEVIQGTKPEITAGEILDVKTSGDQVIVKQSGKGKGNRKKKDATE